MSDKMLWIEIFNVREDNGNAILAFAKSIGATIHGVFEQANCEECGKAYKKWRKDQRFCSRKCANRWRVRKWRDVHNITQSKKEYKTLICPACGKEFSAYHSKRMYCSSECYHKYYYRTKLKAKRKANGDEMSKNRLSVANK